ncbi:MAG: hypothetical protein ABID35_02425, partial [Candidatus Margulisiibacteriota bacterium]
MCAKRIAAILAVFVCLSGQVIAAESPKIKLDPWGNIQSFWLETSSGEAVAQQELKFSPSELAPTRTLYNFSREIISYDIIADITKIHLVYEERSDQNNSFIYFTGSRNSGQTFSEPQQLAAAGKNPALVSQNELLVAVWEQQGTLYIAESQDNGQIFTQPKTLSLTDEALSSPALVIDQDQLVRLCFLAQNKNTGLNRIMYAQLDPASALTEPASFEPKAIFQSHDEITNLQIKINSQAENGLIIFWQNQYLKRLKSYYVVSLDQGESFSSEQLLNYDHELL